MLLSELKEQLIKKQIKPIYVFTGSEIAIMNIYINKIADISKCNIKRVDSISSIYAKLQNKTFLSKPNCYIIRNDKEYTLQEKIWNGLNKGDLQGDNIIILVFDNIDKRSKFYKEYSGQIVEFEKLSTEVLSKYIKKEIGLSESFASDLAEICDRDYSRILLECDKLKHLSKILNKDINGTYQTALQQKLIYVSPKDVIFNFIDSVCRRQVKSAYKFYDELLAINESPLAIISLLYNNFRSMLLVQSAGNGDIVNRTGLTAWQVKVAKEKGNNYKVPELVKALRTIREAERGIKIGTLEQAIAVDYILINIL